MPQGLSSISKLLERRYGPPEPPAIVDPFETILYDQIAYLATDARRLAAFEALRERVGLAPKRILSAKPAVLAEIASLGGIHGTERSARLRESAQIVLETCDGDLRAALEGTPLREQRKLLRRFPMIGEPGADKILLFSGLAAQAAFESNGIRVLARFWFGAESPNYATTYKNVLARIPPGDDVPALVRAHQLARRHGQQVCRRSAPLCAGCALAAHCAYHAS
jgi:endonuclease III